MYDYIIITHIPAFYKVNLYNEMSKKLKLHVVFIASETTEKRATDFINTKPISFSYEILDKGSFQHRSKLRNIRKLRAILLSTPTKRVLVSGWDLVEFWYLVCSNVKKKNYLALESTIFESRTDGVRGWIKKLFLSRVSGVFASGLLHKQLLLALSFKGNIYITQGVGVINKPKFSPVIRLYKKKYLYVGRLSEEKNLTYLVQTFNELDDVELTIVGTGPLKEKLENLAKQNIYFHGQVDNAQLKSFYMENDFLILPSLREPWGLVVEEALYFGLPVVISNKCGASELIKDGVNGLIFDPEVPSSLKVIINEQTIDSYSGLSSINDSVSIKIKDERQVKSYALP
ncbi:glycosyl transferase [Methylophaga sp. 41_12_T18]|nr:glycosyl transferase [Methylophaga sp. 41_12_T18]